MNKDETRKRVEVMLAFAEGKEVEYRTNADDPWCIATSPSWDWRMYEYRVKHVAPKPPEVKLLVRPDWTVATDMDGRWYPNDKSVGLDQFKGCRVETFRMVTDEAPVQHEDPIRLLCKVTNSLNGPHTFISSITIPPRRKIDGGDVLHFVEVRK